MAVTEPDRAAGAGGEAAAVTEPTVSPLARLASLLPLAASIGAAPVAGELRPLLDRLRGGRVYVACVGQFKRGKSTLINALVEQNVLPTGVTPVTSIVTVLRFGDGDEAEVHLLDGRVQPVPRTLIADYVTERGNPGNRKGVAAVVVPVPSPLLAGGLCLVDTPGVGSVFAGSSAATQAFLPHIDAVLFVVGPEPPVTSGELDMVAQVRVRTGDLVVVLNKADRVGPADLAEVAAFTERVVADRIGSSAGPPLCVSAAERMAGRVTRDWPLMRARVAEIGARSATVLDAAAWRHLQRLAAQLADEVRERREALTRPLEESEARVHQLRALAREAELALRDLRALLRLEQDRLRARFSEWRQRFLDDAVPRARAELETGLRSMLGRRVHERAMEVARTVAREHVLRWHGEREPDVRAVYAAIMVRFVERARELHRRAAPLAGDPVDDDPADGNADLTEAMGFHFTDLLSIANPGLLGWMVDAVGPAAWSAALARRRAARYLERLMATNSARLANDFEARVRDSQDATERALRARLDRIVAVAERALAEAKARLAEGGTSVGEALAALDAVDREIARASQREGVKRP